MLSNQQFLRMCLVARKKRRRRLPSHSWGDSVTHNGTKFSIRDDLRYAILTMTDYYILQ